MGRRPKVPKSVGSSGTGPLQSKKGGIGKQSLGKMNWKQKPAGMMKGVATRVGAGFRSASDQLSGSGNALDDSYPESHQNAQSGLYNGNITAVGQTFTSGGGNIASAVFYLKKAGSPTGNATAKLYAISGTFGTNSIPTGAALATSDLFDVSTLPTSFALVTFYFSDANQYLMGPGNYAITFEYGGGDASNRPIIGFNNSSPTHPGNFVKYVSGGWTPSSPLNDTCFYVYRVALADVATRAISPGRAISD